MALIHTFTGGNHTYTIEENTQGGITVKGNNYRAVEFNFGGGEMHVSLPGSLPNSDTCGFNVTNEHATVTEE